jgi:hypothetical protein
MKTALTAIASAVILSACAGNYNPRYQINEIVILNNSDQALRNVSIRSADRVFSCDNVAPRGICSDRFPRRNYQPGLVEIEWSPGNAPRQSESLAGEVPATFFTGLALRGVLEVGSGGEFDAYFEQETPFR